MHHLHLHSGARKETAVEEMLFQGNLSNAAVAVIVAAVESAATPAAVGKLAVMAGRLVVTGRLTVVGTIAGVGRLVEAGRIAEIGKTAVAAWLAVSADRLAQTAAALYQWEQRFPVVLKMSATNSGSGRTMVCHAQS